MLTLKDKKGPWKDMSLSYPLASLPPHMSPKTFAATVTCKTTLTNSRAFFSKEKLDFMNLQLHDFSRIKTDVYFTAWIAD